MNTSPEPAQYFNDVSEPLTSYENWSFAHRHPHNSVSTICLSDTNFESSHCYYEIFTIYPQNTERSVSPKIPINLSHHSHDLSASSHAVHLSSIEMKILQVNKHLQWYGLGNYLLLRLYYDVVLKTRVFSRFTQG